MPQLVSTLTFPTLTASTRIWRAGVAGFLLLSACAPGQPPALRTRLDALDFKALATDRRIDLVRGRLTGVFARLPGLDQGPEAPAVVETGPERKMREQAAADSLTLARLEADRKAMAKRLFTYIQTGRWQKASGLVHPNEWELFLDKEGNLTDLSERRLQAMAMVLESEKKFFRSANGTWRDDRIARLKELDPGEWRKLYLYHDVLLGVAEAAIGFDALRAEGI